MGENAQIRSKLDDCKTTNDIIQKAVHYHNNCWNANVTNKSRRKSDQSAVLQLDNIVETEFLSGIDDYLREEKVLSTTQCYSFYENVCNLYGRVPKDKRALKQMISDGIPDVEFTKQKQLNNPEVISLKSTKADILIALRSLGQSEAINIDADIFKNIEKLICSVYMPRTDITQLSALRWHFFAKKNAHGETLPPTLDSLIPAIKRANYTCMEWARDSIPFPNLPKPSEEHGWKWSAASNIYEPVMCDIECAPAELVENVKCSCKKNKCRNCKCAKKGVLCTEMCACGADLDKCTNIQADESDEDYDHDE